MYIFAKDLLVPNIMHFTLSNTVFDDYKMQFAPTGDTITLKSSYFLNSSSESGMSGSPVFYKYKNEVVFGGVVSSHFASNTTLVVKPSEVLKMIDRQLKK
jgi:hypothetical protein